MDMDIRGRWLNQNGSSLVIQSVTGGQLQGHFESKKGRAARGISYPICGFQNGEIVSFQVSFVLGKQNLHSITSFSGRLLVDPDGLVRLHTQWTLARQFEDSKMTQPTQLWNTYLTNADVFSLIETFAE